MVLTWTKQWRPTDEGVTLKAIDLRNLQDDVVAGVDEVSAEIAALDEVYAPLNEQLVFWESDMISYDDEAVYVI